MYPTSRLEHCQAPFLGLTVQPCGESCGSAAEFAFLTIELIQIENKSDSLVTESILLVSTMFYALQVQNSNLLTRREIKIIRAEAINCKEHLF